MFVPCEQCPLRRRTVFRPFSDNELLFITQMKTDHIVVAPRVDIIREDEVGGPVYTLFEGWAVRYHRLPNGARQILDIVLPGDMVGLASAVLGRVKHSVQAITPATLCVLEGRGAVQRPSYAGAEHPSDPCGGGATHGCPAVTARAQHGGTADRIFDAGDVRPASAARDGVRGLDLSLSTAAPRSRRRRGSLE